VLAAEARAFADAIGPVGAALDRALGEFKVSYLDLKDRLHRAEQREYGPSAAVVGTALANAWRNLLWTVTELDVKPPGEGPRRSFSSLTASWSAAAEGAAKRLTEPPASPTRPNGSNGAARSPASTSERRAPRQVDVGERFADDPAGFEIKEIPRR
jgi:hypothetical protein